MIRQGSQISNDDVIVLILSKDDIKQQIIPDYDDSKQYPKYEKRVNEIFGMAKQGKFTEIIMTDFWESIEACNNILSSESAKIRKHYQELGERIETIN